MLGLLPPHGALLELELAHRFRCSQSTVRESLLRLQEEGLVIRVPHRGTHVAECLMDDMIELLRLRRDIECRSIVRVVQRYGRLTHTALTNLVEKMFDAAKEDDEYALSRLDCQFHMRIYEDAGLPSVRPVLYRCLVHNHRYKILNAERNQPLFVIAERHIPILDALNSGDVAKAVDALAHHITTIVDFGPSVLDTQPAQDRE
ncbi:MAG: GntR family transcriptional regulator [Rhodospirillales bacterium]|nr:GntR family transcriptional regulator [Rhodospirillales bacterium]